MRTPTYEVRRIGDQYVPVLKDAYPGVDRYACLGGGMLLAYMGAARRGWLGTLACVAGAALLIRGTTGCPAVTLLSSQIRRRGPDPHPDFSPSYQNDWPLRAPQAPADVVDEQSMESFPASDPPASSGASLG